MKTLKINSFRMTIQALLVIILFTSACAQSKKNTSITTNNSEIQKQKDLETILQKEKEEWQFKQRITADLNSEKERLTTKQLKIQKLEQTKLYE